MEETTQILGPRTTSDSEKEGRLKVDAGKRKILKKLIKSKKK